MSSIDNWEKTTLRKISRLDQVTDLGKIAPSLKPWEHTNLEIWDFTPNERLDPKTQARFKLIGPEWSIIQQTSMIKAIHDMLGKRLGYLVSLEEFFAQWEEGFKAYPVREGKLKTNYPLEPVKEGETTNIPAWRGDKDTRPFFIEWKNKPNNAKAKSPEFKKIRVIEYWRDRSKTKESVLLTGSDSEIIRHILQMEYEGGGTAGGDSKNIRENESILIGQPMVTFYFREFEPKESRRPIEAEYSCRLMGFTDNPNEVTPRIELLTPANLKVLAEKIKTVFWPSGDIASRFAYEKGKKSCSYRDIKNGYKLWILVKNEADGEKIVKKLLEVQNVIFNENKLVFSSVKNPVVAFPETDVKIQTLGKERNVRTARPEATMRFWKASIKLSLWPQKITLINYDGTLFQDSFLDQIAS